MLESLQELSAYIDEKARHYVQSVGVAGGELVVQVKSESLLKLVQFLRDDANCYFKQLVDVCGVDWPHREKRFDVVYHMLSFRHNQRVRVKVELAERESVPSLVGLYPASNWFEREAYDLYGIYFSDHPDLRRLLTDYGFEGHPLRKDFPLTGHVEVRYDPQQQRVVYEPVQLTQQFRDFDYLSPWSGADYPLPGDEKADGEAA